jgi:hypothetical protein
MSPLPITLNELEGLLLRVPLPTLPPGLLRQGCSGRMQPECYPAWDSPSRLYGLTAAASTQNVCDMCMPVRAGRTQPFTPSAFVHQHVAFHPSAGLAPSLSIILFATL